MVVRAVVLGLSKSQEASTKTEHSFRSSLQSSSNLSANSYNKLVYCPNNSFQLDKHLANVLLFSAG